ncbi:hypothetical protein H2200_003876 [Cladophialophora chaetospira]|uniref:Uncharacterized protein n=1 Tax=Cladophialophora chaetospira TaxID=386627 RepID=A0AA38XFU0_9EURO|nr:hypothetical protein H2200_003876 [Cladophialophora chaetospira]
MGCFDVFCTFCGGPLVAADLWDSRRSTDPEPGGHYWDYNQNLLKDEDLEWLPDVRMVGEWQSKADRDKHIDAKAQVYYASEFDPCMGPFDATDVNGVSHWCYAFAKGENEDHYPGYHFVMHSACLLIAKCLMFEEGKSIQDLYNALCVYNPQDFIGVYLPNRHYGAEKFWQQDWVAEQGWEFMVKDPVNIPNMTEYILSKLQTLPSKEDQQLKSLSDVRSFACPCSSGGSNVGTQHVEGVEQKCTCAAQDQDFYRKELLSGRLLVLRDLDMDLVRKRWDEVKVKDWRRLVQTLVRYENYFSGEDGSGALGELHDAPVGLKNRMRIIKILQGIFTGT